MKPLLVLLAVSGGPRHGSSIQRWMRAATGGRVRITEGSLYSLLHRLVDQGLLDSRWGPSENKRRAKYLTLTPDGEETLERWIGRWREVADGVEGALSTMEP